MKSLSSVLAIVCEVLNVTIWLMFGENSLLVVHVVFVVQSFAIVDWTVKLAAFNVVDALAGCVSSTLNC